MESREIIFVGGDLSTVGFKIAGVKSLNMNTGKESLLSELKDKKAILILTQEASELFGEDAEKLKKTSHVIVIPEKENQEYTSIKNLIKDTIGFELKY